MKIALIAPRYHTNQKYLIEYLVKKKVQISFYATRVGQSEDHSLIKPSIIKLNYLIRFLKLFIVFNNPLFDYKYGFPSLKDLKQFKSAQYDLLIIRDPINFMGLSYFFWAKFNRVKIIFYIQREIHKKKKFKTIELIERRFINFFNIKCISPCLGNIKYKKFIKNIDYLPFCMPAVKYSKKWFLNGKINIINVGKFIDRKNHLILIKALSKINFTNKFELTIVGECTTSRHFKNLEKIKKQINLNGLKVKILTNLKPKLVLELYKKNDLFILPSVDEPASVSNLEAMAYGLPVITTDTNSTSCYTENKINGFIVKANDIHSLRNKIQYFLDNKSELIKFGNASHKLVKEKYNPKIVYNNFFKYEMK